MAKKINITAQLNAATTDGILASANQIYDENKGKFQEQVNQEVESALEEAITSEDTGVVVESIEEGIIHNALRKNKQILTEAEKYQARHNISAITAEEAEKIAQDKINESAVSSPDKLQAVKELSSWLESNPDNAATMNAAIQDNSADIQRLYRGTGIGEYSEFSSLTDYAAGAVVLYDGVLFRFKADHAKGAWDYNEVEEWSEKKEREKKLTELGSYVENPEYACAYTDAEGRFLWGIKQDGSIEFAKGVPTSIKAYIDSLDRNNDDEIERINSLLIGLTNEVTSIINDVTDIKDTYHFISNEEWAMAILDAQNKILMGIKADGSYYVPNRDFYHVESTEEYLNVVLDADNKIVFGIRKDGSVYIPKGMSKDAEKAFENLTKKIDENQLAIAGLIEYLQFLSFEDNPEYVNVVTDSDGKVLEGITKDGKKYLPTQEHFDKYNDVEDRTELTLDAENKVIGYRDNRGIRHEKEMHIEVVKTKELHAESVSVENLNLTDNNANQIKDALDNINYLPKLAAPNDFSNDEVIELPIPRVAASVRLIVPKMPTSKTADIEGFLEYYDKDGNYFKKAIVLNSQGSSSMGYIRPDGSQGNLGVDFVDCEIKFGSWVSQDSFHIKKYYIDAFRGQCVVGYHLMEQVYQTHPYGEKKPYDTIIQNDNVTDSLGKFKKDFNTGALCHPDGFPIVIYVNTGGEDIFYGVYAWCLKKHRDNYYCDKANPDNIILDGVITKDTLFGGQIDWTQFEIRNPKDLVDINGNEYDGDNPKELSNTDELSAAVKNNIVRLSGVVDAMIANNSKETFEQYFLPKYFIDYYIISQVIYNVDGFHKNWIWCTWDGQHWTPTLYDVDSIFGMMPIGTFVNKTSAKAGLLGETITSYLTQFYSNEIKERYHELRDKGVFSVDNIVGLLESWIKRIGYQNLKDDLERFNQTPSYRKSYLNDEVWELVSYSWNTSNNDYDEDKTYNVGDTCYFYGYLMKAKIQNIGLAPFSQIYNNHPQASGFYNSLARVKNWLMERVSFLDSNYNYTNL